MGAWEDGFASGYERALQHMRTSPGGDKVRFSGIKPRAGRKPKRRPRKITAYNRFMKKEMKALRRKHPRMKQPQIMKKAALAWRRKKRG
jgi:hypothetical protein